MFAYFWTVKGASVLKHLLFILASLLLGAFTAMGQGLSSSSTNKNVPYRILNDEPTGTNRIWLHFHPLVAELYHANMNMGFGGQINVLISKKFDGRIVARSTYDKITDQSRFNALTNSGVYFLESTGPRRFEFQKAEIANRISRYTNLEAVVTYHVKEEEKRNQAKVVLTSKKRRNADLLLADYIYVTAKERVYYGARLGAQYIESMTNANVTAFRQNVTLSGSDGSIITPDGFTIDKGGQVSDFRNSAFVGFRAPALVLGGSYNSMRNLTIRADKYGNMANNIIWTVYGDLLVAPTATMDDIRMQRPNEPGLVTFETDPLRVSKVGWRVGADVMFNQDFFFSYGGEIGMRPGPASRNFYIMGKIGFPVLSFKSKGATLSTNLGQTIK